MLRDAFEGRLPRFVRSSATNALEKGADALDLFDLKLTDPKLQTVLSNRTREFLVSLRKAPLTGYGLPMSSRAVRTASTKAMIETTLRFGLDHPEYLTGRSRIRLLTMCPDVGLIDIASGTFPAERTKLTVRRLMQHQELQGIGMLDLSLFSPRRGEPEHLAHIHSHHVILPNFGKGGTVARMEASLSPARDPKNGLGAPVAVISKQDAFVSHDRLAGLGWYITKESCGANTIFQCADGQKSECSFTDWSLPGALRQLEFWSYVDVLKACWSLGRTGALMRNHWRTRLLRYLDFCELPRQSTIDFDERQRGWESVWRELGSDFTPIDPTFLLSETSKANSRSC